jgi:ferric-dicitrate binding protein FerR (iron transport regulator)
VVTEVNQTAAWKEGVFYFDDKPLVSIFDEIERQFDVSIQFEGDTKRSITVSFTNKKLEETLDVVCIPMGLKYEVDNKNNVRITENNR